MTNVQRYPPTPAQAHPPANKHKKTELARTPQSFQAQQGDTLSLKFQNPPSTEPHFGKNIELTAVKVLQNPIKGLANY